MTNAIGRSALNLVAAANKLDTLKVAGRVDAGRINTLSASLRKRADNLDTDMHVAAVAAIIVSTPQEEGGSLNGEPARRLLNCVPRMTRAKALADWFAVHSNIVLKLNKAKDEWTVTMTGPKSDKYKVATPVLAMEKPFWIKEEVTKPIDFDIGAMLATLMAKAEKADALGKLDAEQSAQVRALVTFANDSGIPTESRAKLAKAV